jgi:Pilus assembly protein, PilO
MNVRFERLRPLFLARSRREKMLAVLFVTVSAVIWAILWTDRVRRFSPEMAKVRADAREQSNWLDQQTVIQARYDEVLAKLRDSGDNSGRLAHQTVDQIVRKYGFSNFRIDPPQPQRKEGITLHPINVTVFKGEWRQLAALFNEIVTALPSVNLEEVTIGAPDRSNQKLLDAKFKFVAIEINR